MLVLYRSCNDRVGHARAVPQIEHLRPGNGCIVDTSLLHFEEYDSL